MLGNVNINSNSSEYVKVLNLQYYYCNVGNGASNKLYTYIYTYINTYIHIYIHAYIHYTHTHTHTYTHLNKNGPKSLDKIQLSRTALRLR
jgi:hypothetical protein